MKTGHEGSFHSPLYLHVLEKLIITFFKVIASDEQNYKLLKSASVLSKTQTSRHCDKQVPRGPSSKPPRGHRCQGGGWSEQAASYPRGGML